MKETKINGEMIYLRELNETDASQKYCSWLNDPIVNKYLETRESTVEEVKEYIKNKRDNKNCLFLGIFSSENNIHIGNIKLEPIDFINRKAMLGMIIGDRDYWGKGIATEATKLVVKHAFEKMGLEEVNLGVIPENKAAVRVYEKVGFLKDKLNKNAMKHGDVHYDQQMMIIKRENENRERWA